MSDICLTYNSK